MKFEKAISYFALRQWHFIDQNVVELWQQLSDIDKRLFPFNISDVNWRAYSEDHYFGIRKYLLKDDISNKSRAIKRFRVLVSKLQLFKKSVTMSKKL